MANNSQSLADHSNIFDTLTKRSGACRVISCIVFKTMKKNYGNKSEDTVNYFRTLLNH